jgi:hypothetical protein
VDFRLRIQDWEIDEVYFALTAQETAALEFEAKLEGSLIKKEFQLGKPIQLPKIIVKVGRLPLVFTPVLTFQIGIDGSVHVGS